ncbi:hypothetical protein FVB32_14880 [Flagellimonas hymeniacidonis]|uniref:Uncharacterized protein n=1 Tax=Flagellimonas hymeniacidonis TaxID=2603628 RepID=A0A5C8V445_9FLAO|nr:hypothetical protein [Flagellimonas hymeniacidonis]TXN35849.1 hypothetical protein FVB32_14880 [Flagellimonas hymeniacidonis]
MSDGVIYDFSETQNIQLRNRSEGLAGITLALLTMLASRYYSDAGLFLISSAEAASTFYSE